MEKRNSADIVIQILGNIEIIDAFLSRLKNIIACKNQDIACNKTLEAKKWIARANIDNQTPGIYVGDAILEYEGSLHIQINNVASHFAKTSIMDFINTSLELIKELPRSRPASLATTKLEECMMWVEEIGNT